MTSRSRLCIQNCRSLLVCDVVSLDIHMNIPPASRSNTIHHDPTQSITIPHSHSHSHPRKQHDHASPPSTYQSHPPSNSPCSKHTTQSYNRIHPIATLPQPRGIPSSLHRRSLSPHHPALTQPPALKPRLTLYSPRKAMPRAQHERWTRRPGARRDVIPRATYQIGRRRR